LPPLLLHPLPGATDTARGRHRLRSFTLTRAHVHIASCLHGRPVLDPPAAVFGGPRTLTFSATRTPEHPRADAPPASPCRSVRRKFARNISIKNMCRVLLTGPDVASARPAMTGLAFACEKGACSLSFTPLRRIRHLHWANGSTTARTHCVLQGHVHMAASGPGLIVGGLVNESIRLNSHSNTHRSVTRVAVS
jgi:hypothetical protein